MSLVPVGGGGKAWSLIVLLVALPVLSGCLGTAQATAMETQEPAAEAASSWDPDAQLAQVMGLEGKGWPSMGSMGSWGSMDGSSQMQGTWWDRAGDDPNLGDGHCEIWAYRFVSPNQPDQAYLVVVDRDGEVLHQGEEAREQDERPLGAWEVDSDEAAEIAKEANQGLREGTEKEHYAIAFMLGQDDEHPNPVWMVAGGGGDSSGGGGGFVAIDAATGEVLMSQGGFGGGHSSFGA